jgi:hypothetical protein
MPEPAINQAGQPLGVTGNRLRRQHQQQRIGQVSASLTKSS